MGGKPFCAGWKFWLISHSASNVSGSPSPGSQSMMSLSYASTKANSISFAISSISLLAFLYNNILVSHRISKYPIVCALHIDIQGVVTSYDEDNAAHGLPVLCIVALLPGDTTLAQVGVSATESGIADTASVHGSLAFFLLLG